MTYVTATFATSVIGLIHRLLPKMQMMQAIIRLWSLLFPAESSNVPPKNVIKVFALPIMNEYLADL